MKLSALATLAFLAVPVSAQTTWYVDVAGAPPGTGSSLDPYTSVQYALEQSSTLDGDTVLVLPGIYVESVDLLGKSLTLTSSDGPALTTISAPPLPNPPAPVVTFAGAGVASSVLSGFTLVNGGASDGLGGGIRCTDASLRVEACVITQNQSYSGVIWASFSALELLSCEVTDNLDGPALAIEDSSLLLEDCTVARNEPLAAGGGLELRRSCGVIRGCRFSENNATFGSAIYANDADLEIESCEFTSNFVTPPKGGSALWVGGGSLLMADTTFRGNFSSNGGGAATLNDTDAVVTSSHFIYNRTGLDGYPGGALLFAGGSLEVLDSSFLGNVALRGGAVAVEAGSATFDGCDFVENRTFDALFVCCGEGGAISAARTVTQCTATRCVFARNRANGSSVYGPGTGGAATGPVRLSKCTIIDNFAADGGGGVYGGDPFGLSAAGEVEDCIVYGNLPDQVAGDISVTFSDVEGGWTGAGNFDDDPLFIDAQQDDYHLAPGSPCIDAGNPAGPPDLDGSRADVGAYSFVDCNDNGILDAQDIAMGVSSDANANGFPDECECLVYSYCLASPTSTGEGATMSFSGTTSVSVNDLVLLGVGCPADRNGIFFYGTGQGQLPFGDGWRCVAGQTFRLPVVNTGPRGTAAYALDYGNPGHPSAQITSGSRWNFQFWFRDSGGPGGSGFNLTDGLQIVFCE